MTDTLSQRVYEELRDEITTGQLPPGQWLVRRSIANRLGVSPIPVIEALARLERDGLVVSRDTGGSEVREVTLDVIQDEALLREALECQVARILAIKATERDFDDLANRARQLDDLVERHDSTSKIGRKLHLEFHQRLAHVASSPLLEQQVRSVWLRHLMDVNWINATLLPPPKGWHQQLVNVLRQRDPDKAECKMREHVQYGYENLAATLKQLNQNVKQV